MKQRSIILSAILSAGLTLFGCVAPPAEPAPTAVFQADRGRIFLTGHGNAAEVTGYPGTAVPLLNPNGTILLVDEKQPGQLGTVVFYGRQADGSYARIDFDAMEPTLKLFEKNNVDQIKTNFKALSSRRWLDSERVLVELSGTREDGTVNVEAWFLIEPLQQKVSQVTRQ